MGHVKGAHDISQLHVVTKHYWHLFRIAFDVTHYYIPLICDCIIW